MLLKRANEQQRVFTRRAAVLGAVQLGMMGALIGRLYQLQVVQSDRFATLAEDNRVNLRLLAPPRGHIVDRYGVPLARNIENYRVVLVAEQTPSVEETLDRLSEVISLAEADRRRVLRDVKRRRSFVPLMVRDNLAWEEVSRIEVNAPYLPGTMIEVGRTRDYPHGAVTAHVVGYVGAVSEADLKEGDPVLQLPDFRIGKNGVEKHYDLALRGKAGTSQVEVNARGRIIRELEREEAQPGRQVPLTLDLGLQRYVMERLGEESASVVVLDVDTGDILAMVSNPSYDSNMFARGITTSEWESLLANPRTPLTNKCVAGQYPPGSTFKMVVALAGLESGVIDERSSVFCPGHMTLGSHRFHCWKRGGHGHLSVMDAIAQSCDVFFYETAKRAGIDRVSAMSKRFGVGADLELDLPGERSGLAPTKAWKQATLGKPWNQGETLICGIGQGFVLATPMQLAVMAARLANGGRAVRPHLCRFGLDGGRLMQPEALSGEPMGIDPRHLEIVTAGMDNVVNGPGGTARRYRIATEGMEMAGKTGTAQVKRISAAERARGIRKGDDLPWHLRDHGLFVAFAPLHKPRYACSVIVEHGGGSKAAAPIAKDVLTETQIRDPARIPPLA